MSLKTGCNPTSSATPRRFAALGNAHQDKRVSRLMGKTLSFSKKLENQIGAIGLFIDEYNCVIQKRLAIAPVPLFPLPFTKKHDPLFILYKKSFQEFQESANLSPSF